MKNKYFIFGIISLLVISIVSASMLIPINDNAKERAQAPENSAVITESESGNWEIERVDFIHYARESPGKTPRTPACYSLLGVKWKSLPVNYIINPSNSGLSEEFTISAIFNSAETWDNAVSAELFNNYSVDYNINYGKQDGVNAISFGNYPNNGVIGVTSVWYIRQSKQIVEFDILLDTDFAWGDASINPNVMDLQNIATHELGHGVGLDDIYSDSCSEVTMYGYSYYGEISKRTLENPDITGLIKMYGI